MSGPSQRETRSAVSHTGRCVRIPLFIQDDLNYDPRYLVFEFTYNMVRQSYKSAAGIAYTHR